MANLVLVHGSWHGGWCWNRVVDRLRDLGHKVSTPTLTGLGDRAHLLRRDIDLSSHTEDIVRFLRYQDLKDITLVGHSYAGMVVGSVVEQVPERVESLIFLDAITPRDGASGFDILPGMRPTPEEVAKAGVEDWLMPPLSTGTLGITDPDIAKWTAERLVPMPVDTHSEPMRLPNHRYLQVPCGFIRCAEFPVSAQFGDKAREDGWAYREIPCGHDAMLAAPAELTAALHDLAG